MYIYGDSGIVFQMQNIGNIQMFYSNIGGVEFLYCGDKQGFLCQFIMAC